MFHIGARVTVGMAMLTLLSGCGLLGMIFEGPECQCAPPAAQAPAKPVSDAALPPPSQPAQFPEPKVESAPIPPAGAPPTIAAAPTPLAPMAPGATPLPPQIVPPAVPPPAPLAPTALPGAAQFGAQLGAFRSRANADRAWTRFKDQYGDLLAAMPGPLLREVDLGQKGRFTRVMSGPFASQQAAQSLCMEVLARGGFCHVQRLGR